LFVAGLAGMCGAIHAAEPAQRPAVFAVTEFSFAGPQQTATNAPARDVELTATFRHESDAAEMAVQGFWDGDGRGGTSGNVFKIRFCPTKPGRWTLAEVRSNRPELSGQRQGESIVVEPSELHGFWEVDEASPGRRWYRRSDGSHQYVLSNTHYSFLSGYGPDGKPSGNEIAADVRRNAEFFKKLRFGLTGCRYPNPDEKPFLDDAGRPTDDGNFSHRPNPRWFHQRADLAVCTAMEADLVADLILCGPDTEESRSTLKASANHGDPTPWLRYIAARYGSYPNVWICLCNEFDIKKPKYTAAEIAGFGATIARYLPYPTPLSVHTVPATLWPVEFDLLPPWSDHQIIQKKIRTLAPSADAIQMVWRNRGGKGPRNRPTVNDELSYQGDGDKHSEQDTIEAHLGALLGGGYGTTGFKPGNKLGHYFWGRFDPAEHTAADNLKWLREVVDEHVAFWQMAPDFGIFENLDGDFRGLGWPGRQYVLGTDKARAGIVANLPEGTWTVTCHDVIAKRSEVLSGSAAGRFTFDAPESRAVLFDFQRN
jgi:hypothetical protein